MSFGILVIDLPPLDAPWVHYGFGTAAVDGKRTLTRLLDRAQSLQVPIIALSAVHRTEECFPNVQDSLIFRYLSLEEIIEKPFFDAFRLPGFSSSLKSKGLTNLVITGYHRDICVRSTAEGALTHGFDVLTSEHWMFTGKQWESGRAESLAFFQKYTRFFASPEDGLACIASHSRAAPFLRHTEREPF